MIKKWYCYKCKMEAERRHGERYWRYMDLAVPLDQLKEDKNRKGLYLCEKHQN